MPGRNPDTGLPRAVKKIYKRAESGWGKGGSLSKERRALGAFGENLAADFLQRKGYKILYKNFKCKLGEVDIIAEDRKTLVFVEVRTRRDANYGLPMESILWNKKIKLISIAKFYIEKFSLEDRDIRFDVVSILYKKWFTNINIIKDAFWEV